MEGGKKGIIIVFNDDTYIITHLSDEDAKKAVLSIGTSSTVCVGTTYFPLVNIQYVKIDYYDDLEKTVSTIRKQRKSINYIE